MKIIALLALALLAPSFSAAQDFFGLTSGDVAAMIGQVQADQKLQRLRALGSEPSRLPSVGKALGFTKTLSSRQDCIFDAVEASMGVAQIRPGTEFPDVLYASEVNADRYRAAVKAEFPSATPSEDVATIYLPGLNVIYVADASSAYAKGARIDEALAGQYARFLDWTQRDVRDPARLDADDAAAAAAYRAQYPAGTTSCRP
ncbi:MAG: hypothetical protein KGJ84_04515 [Elusimicrobia bacterium]|nr:hypothetical protein [Elusimicrobiota bacterium]